MELGDGMEIEEPGITGDGKPDDAGDEVDTSDMWLREGDRCIDSVDMYTAAGSGKGRVIIGGECELAIASGEFEDKGLSLDSAPCNDGLTV